MMTVLHDDDKDLDFEIHGEVIGSATSKGRGVHRWTEVTIYRTDSGSFVVHKQGKSVIFHAENTSCNTKAPIVDFGALTDEHEPCSVCQPNESAHLFRLERDRSAVHLCGTNPEGVTESLMSVDGDGVTYMNNTAARALKAARLAAPELRTKVRVA